MPIRCSLRACHARGATLVTLAVLTAATSARAHGNNDVHTGDSDPTSLLPPLPNGPALYVPTTDSPSPGSIVGGTLGGLTGDLVGGTPEGAAGGTPGSPPSYTLFESGQTRPLALSPDGKFLFALNTPDDRLEVFKIDATGALTPRCSVPVGVEPVALAVRDAHEVWVVNHVSDSISIVQLDNATSSGQVVRTLLVGDEPRDIVFAGPLRRRAFVTTAHRGQNSPVDAALTTAGVGRADVWVFDTLDLGLAPGGKPTGIVTLFTNAPRAIAASPDGSRVYAAGFLSDNATSSVFAPLVPVGPEETGGAPGPETNHEGNPRPDVAVIVKFDGQHWVDFLGRTWDQQMPFTLPDRDVFAIDAMASPPVALAGESYAHVGTVLFNIAVNPVSGALYVSNLDARNVDQFVGPGTFAGRTLRGHFAESHLTVIRDGKVLPRHINKHIDYASCCNKAPNVESETSLAFPVDMTVSSDGKTLYAAALGSSKVGLFDTAKLEADTFVPSQSAQVEVSGGGPSGLALDEKRGKLYVLTRFDDGVSVVDLATRKEVSHVTMHDPEPPLVTRGRQVLYDARHTSSHGDSACASCHIFGDFDGIGWDLGAPDGDVADNPNPVSLVGGVTEDTGTGEKYHPMKGPMVTQSLRGMKNHGPLHWRGDKTGAYEEDSAQPDAGAFDERAAFLLFNAAFPDLMGRDLPIADADMEAFADFAMELTYPPNPIRRLDNELTPTQEVGRDFYFADLSFQGQTCNECHRLDPKANAGYTDRPGFFGAAGFMSFLDNQEQQIKTPHLRNQYQKVGRFGLGTNPLLSGTDTFQGEQVKGFGFLHDGSVDTINHFFTGRGFMFPSEEVRRDVEEFQLVFDSNLAPVVGQQMTLTAANAASAGGRVDLLVARANAAECDLVVKSVANGVEIGYLYVGAATFIDDRAKDAPVSDAALRQTATLGGRILTYTCAAPGSGKRLGIDRDLDGWLDGDERVAATSVSDPLSHP